jgi:hypothetical protein
MLDLLKRLLLAVVSLCCGVILGYFVVDSPIIPIASERAVEWFVPLVKDIHAWLYARGLQYLLVAALIFAAAVPNIALLSILVALFMRVSRKPRLVFYATLVWPLLHYLLDADRILRIKAGLERSGLNPNVSNIMGAEGLPTKAVGMLLVYSLFSILVFSIYRWLSRRHNKSFNTDAQTSGAPVS